MHPDDPIAAARSNVRDLRAQLERAGKLEERARIQSELNKATLELAELVRESVDRRAAVFPARRPR